MPIVCKWVIDGEENQASFENVEEMMSHKMYNDFHYMNMDNSSSTYMPLILPKGLQILSFQNNKILDLPHLPLSLHSLYGKNNRISSFPIIQNCTELEIVDFESNDIMTLDTVIPNNVKSINLDFNKLRYINYEKLDSSTLVSASYNFLTALPPDTHIRHMKFDHNDIPDKIYYKAVMMLENRTEIIHWNERVRENFAPFVPTAPIRQNIIAGTDAQSVHNSSIQTSTNSSLYYVMHYVPKNPQPEDLITEVIRAYKKNIVDKSRIRKLFYGISRNLAETAILAPPIREWCLRNDIHSQYGVTYKTLLKQVWAIIHDNEHKDAMKEVLFQEMDDSRHVCFTGRFTRTLNALTGFIEEVKIGINSKEQMGNQITMAIKKAKEKLGDDFQEEARTNVKNILVEFEVPEIEHEAWLDAIE